MERASGGSGTTYFNHADWLGTERARTAVNGTLCESITSLPFGDGETTTGTCGDPSTHHFDGKERDTETGNDNFGARYYSSQAGRWLSADWSSVPVPVPYANLTNPQTLNLYAMVSDDPVTFADLDGHEGPVAGVSFSGAEPLVITGGDNPDSADQATMDPELMGASIFNDGLDLPDPSAEAAADAGTQTADNAANQNQNTQDSGAAWRQEMANKDVASPDPLGDAIIGAVAGAAVSAFNAATSLIGDIVGSGSRGAAEDTVSAAVPKPGSANAEGAGKAFSKSTGDAVREESGDRCVFCGKKTTREPGPNQSNIDHSIPKSRGGDNSLANAQNTCRTCNLAKGAMTTVEFLLKAIPPMIF